MRWLLPMGMLLSGCTSPPSSRVTLMPDEDGHVGAVWVSNAQGKQKIDQAFTSVKIETARSAPSEATQTDHQAFEAAHGSLLKAQPSKPRSFVLHFMLDSTELTSESKLLLTEVLQTARDRKPTEVCVFGHADAIGTEHSNLTLSSDRARVVAELLRKSDPGLHIEVNHFGDKVPLIPSRPGIPEPRNRRVEVNIL